MLRGQSAVAFASSVSSGAASSCCLLGAATAAVAAFVTSRVDRCNSLLAGAPPCLLDGLQSVLKAAARFICNRRKYDHITPILRDVLHWLPVPFRIEYNPAYMYILVFLSLHGAA